MRTTFNLMFSLVEFFVGLGFLFNMFGSSEAMGWLQEAIGSMFSQAEYATSALSQGSLSLSGPAAFLIIVLGFMIFAYTLFNLFPGVTEKIEKQNDFEAD